MGAQIMGIVSQYLVIIGGLIGLFLILRKPDALSKLLDSFTKLGTGTITAFTKS